MTNTASFELVTNYSNSFFFFFLKLYSRQIAENSTLIAENASSSTKIQKAQWKKKRLKLNVNETKLMTTGRTISFRIDNEDFKMVASFCILGSSITGTGTSGQEIR